MGAQEECGPATRTQECVQGPGLSEGPASGFTQATHSRPLAAQEPSSFFQGSRLGPPALSQVPQKALHGPQRQNKASPLSETVCGAVATPGSFHIHTHFVPRPGNHLSRGCGRGVTNLTAGPVGGQGQPVTPRPSGHLGPPAGTLACRPVPGLGPLAGLLRLLTLPVMRAPSTEPGVSSLPSWHCSRSPSCPRPTEVGTLTGKPWTAAGLRTPP